MPPRPPKPARLETYIVVLGVPGGMIWSPRSRQATGKTVEGQFPSPEAATEYAESQGRLWHLPVTSVTLVESFKWWQIIIGVVPRVLDFLGSILRLLK